MYMYTNRLTDINQHENLICYLFVSVYTCTCILIDSLINQHENLICYLFVVCITYMYMYTSRLTDINQHENVLTDD